MVEYIEWVDWDVVAAVIVVAITAYIYIAAIIQGRALARARKRRYQAAVEYLKGLERLAFPWLSVRGEKEMADPPRPATGLPNSWLHGPEFAARINRDDWVFRADYEAERKGADEYYAEIRRLRRLNEQQDAEVKRLTGELERMKADRKPTDEERQATDWEIVE